MWQNNHERNGDIINATFCIITVWETWYLGDNCIVFENFTASIEDLMVANWVYWQPWNRQLMPWNFQNTIQLSPF